MWNFLDPQLKNLNCIKIYVTIFMGYFGGNLNAKYLRIMGLLAVILGAKIILCLCKKKVPLCFIGGFLIVYR